MNNIKKDQECYPLTWMFRKDKKTVWLKEYENNNGYNAANKSVKNMQSNEIISLIKDAGLKGRGGAGFPTGIKWDLINKDDIKSQKYLLCNADEMEPGTYKDRFLLENVPHQLIEGMIIAAFAITANCGYIFLRGEYINIEKIVKKAICEAYSKKYLGKNIFNSSFSFDLFLHTGAGRYICGEETALINSLEGRRANPRSKPPFPAHSGLWGYPTCVNNVETLYNVAPIISNGSNWYKKLSKSNVDFGTKLMGFSGKVNNPGVWELPFGITAREILEDYAGGMKKGFKLKAWQPGGASTDFLLPEDLDVCMDFFSVKNKGSRLGTALSMAVDDKTNIVSLLLNIETFFARESCGLCTPCRDGLPWIVKILKKIKRGKGEKRDIKILYELCTQLGPGKTFCSHAPGAMEPLQSALNLFKYDFKVKKNKNSKKKTNLRIDIKYDK
ncbi:NADH-quinone oxidoreductase subunit NuoF [Buchnera aphidicola (Taiwanaphis decaspermi)]|uniref:NADH-quinone oxidoreductase subunit NuoF n=1 Tax=Buchnera aphidicola TaxID=9 RepID=UPI0031B7EF24